MLKKLVLLKGFCVEQVESYNLTKAEWEDLEYLLAALSPAFTTSQKIQLEQLYLGDFFKNWLELKLVVQDIPNSYSIIFSNCLKKRETKLLENVSVLSALYLDPRLRRIINKEPIQLLNARTHLKKLIRQIYELEQQTSGRMNNSNETQPCTSLEALVAMEPNSISIFSENSGQSTGSLLSTFLNAIEVSTSEEQSDDGTDERLTRAFREVEEYSPKALSIEVNLMGYWENMRFIFPNLFNLATIIHSVPATQVSVERSFSGLKIVLSDLRCNLSSENLERLMFAKFNS